jgi:hypothetical protein
MCGFPVLALPLGPWVGVSNIPQLIVGIELSAHGRGVLRVGSLLLAPLVGPVNWAQHMDHAACSVLGCGGTGLFRLPLGKWEFGWCWERRPNWG